MGEVYRAFDSDLGRQVAVKIQPKKTRRKKASGGGSGSMGGSLPQARVSSKSGPVWSVVREGSRGERVPRRRRNAVAPFWNLASAGFSHSTGVRMVSPTLRRISRGFHGDRNVLDALSEEVGAAMLSFSYASSGL